MSRDIDDADTPDDMSRDAEGKDPETPEDTSHEAQDAESLEDMSLDRDDADTPVDVSQDRKEAFAALRRLVSEEENFFISTDDRSLSMFLYWTDFNPLLAFEKMKSLYRAKAEYKDWYAHRREPVHDAILKRGIHVLLNSRDQKGRRIYLLRPGNMVYGEFEPPEMFQVDDLWALLAMDEEKTQRQGLVTLVDFGGMSWRFLRYYTPWYIRAASAKLENVPLRHSEFHILNAGIVLNTIVKVVFPFLKQSVKDSLFFHSSLESLHEHVSPSALPEEYGGEGPPVDTDRLVREFLDTQQQRLEELLSFGYTKEIGKQKK